MGRPTKLNDEVTEKVVTAIKAGSYVETAAAFAGVSKSTLYDWLKRGANQKEGIYREFSAAVEQALAHADIRDIGIIATAAQKGVWQAAAWRLERKHPDQWGRRQVIQVGTGDEIMRTQEIDLSLYTDQELDDLEKLLKKGKTQIEKEEEKTQ